MSRGLEQVSKVKVYSFTISKESFSLVTPLGLITAQNGEQVTVTVSETWEQAADAVRLLRQQEPEPSE